jgi:multimeric flavodoxin WrbA
MKILGFSSGVVGRDSNVDRMVKAIMEKCGGEHEFVKLNDLSYSACKGRVWLCAGPQVCQLEDDLLPYYEKVRDANAVVLGSPIHFGTVNAAMLGFISRLWGFRHVTIPIKNKPFALALSRAGNARSSEDDFRRALMPYQVNIVDVVSYQSTIPPCYSCRRHQECRIGGAYMIWGEKTPQLEITPDLFRQWEDQPDTVAKIEAASEKLRNAIDGVKEKGVNSKSYKPIKEVLEWSISS